MESAGLRQGQRTIPQRRCARLHTCLGRWKDKGSMRAQDAGIGRLPRRPQDQEPSAVDLDLVRARRQRARAEGRRRAQRERLLQLL